MLQQLFQGGDRIGDRASGMTRRLRIALIGSVALHVAVLLFLLIGLPAFTPKEEPPPETTIAMVFAGAAKSSMQAQTPCRGPGAGERGGAARPAGNHAAEAAANRGAAASSATASPAAADPCRAGAANSDPADANPAA